MLLVFGELGSAALYWDTGRPFDMENVGIIGQRENDRDPGLIADPFDVKKTILEKEQKPPDN